MVWQSYRRYPCDEHRNLLVELYKSFVDEIVRRFAGRLPRRVDRGDLDTAANVGLMSAISGFDPTRGVRFEFYCERRVRGALLDELRTQDWLPRHWRQRIERHKRILERLRGERNGEPCDEDVARAMEMAPDVYAQTFGIGLPGLPPRSIASMDALEDVGSALEAVADRHSSTPGEQLTRTELLRLVAQKLTELEYRIVYLKYWEELPMREIGELTGLSESRVSKIHANLLDRLKDRFRRE